MTTSSILARRAERRAARAQAQTRERLVERRSHESAGQQAEVRRELERAARRHEARRAEAELVKRREAAARRAAARGVLRLLQRPLPTTSRAPIASDAASPSFHRAMTKKKARSQQSAPSERPRHRPAQATQRPAMDEVSRPSPVLEKGPMRPALREPERRKAAQVRVQTPPSSRAVSRPDRTPPSAPRELSRRPAKKTEATSAKPGRNAPPAARSQATERMLGRVPARPAGPARDSAERVHPDLAETGAPPRDILVSRFTSGRLSGPLPWLVTRGSLLLTVDGDALVLRGVNPSGPRADDASPALPADWPLNVVRMIVAAELDPAGSTALDAAVAAQADAGAYTILVTPVSVSSAEPGAVEQLDVSVLLALGERYADEPAVLFEPILAAAAAAEDVAETPLERDSRRLRSVLAPLRALHPRALCLVPVPVDGLPLVSDGRPIPNLLYTLTARPDHASPVRGLDVGSALFPRFIADWSVSRGHSLGDDALLCRLAAAGIGWAANAGPAGWLRPSRGGPEPTAVGRWLLRALTLAAAWERAPARAA